MTQKMSSEKSLQKKRFPPPLPSTKARPLTLQSYVEAYQNILFSNIKGKFSYTKNLLINMTKIDLT